MFSSKLKKQKAIDAYESLSELLQGAYFSKAMEILAALENVEAETGSAAWADFSENSIRFFNTLEDINPGILGTDDAVYGLPEELARKIQEQDFFPAGLL